MNKFKLEPIDALSLKWSEKAYSHRLIKEYYERLDLSPAEDLISQCFEICSWYEEVVLNGKHVINKFIEQRLADCDEKMLILLLSPGKSATALDLLIEHYNKIDRIFEIDYSGMDEKQLFYDNHYSGISEKIKCLTADFRSESILRSLNELFTEFYSNHPSLIIFENATYFLGEYEFGKIVEGFKSVGKNNTFIIEYLVPSQSAKNDVKSIPEQVNRCIADIMPDGKVYSYNSEKIEAIFKEHDGKLINKFDLSKMEKERLGENKYFSRPEDGWMECMICSV